MKSNIKYKKGDIVWVELEYFPNENEHEIVYVGPMKVINSEYEFDDEYPYTVESPIKIKKYGSSENDRNIYVAAEHEIKYKIE